MTASGRIEVVEYGDSGVLVTCRHDDPADRWRAAQSLQAALLSRRDVGVTDVVASFDTAFVGFDPGRTDHAAVADLVAAVADELAPLRTPTTFGVPVVYGGARGPDLPVVADELGLEEAAVVELHTAGPWTVRLRGSPAAAPMMDGSRFAAGVSRNPTPRTRLAPGSVALSGRQCMIYPVASPGGWRVIGRTPVRLVDLAAAELVAYRPGDRLRFFPIAEDAWDHWAGTSPAADPPSTA